MSLFLFILGAAFIFIGGRYTFFKNGKTVQRVGDQPADQEVEIIVGMVVSIGVGPYLKIMMITVGVLFIFFGLICLAVS